MPARVIIVTGVSRGIGRAIALELQSRGAAVVGAARNVADVTGGIPFALTDSRGNQHGGQLFG
jgi:NAD(P)-dependent dehydrogenase (short-subunit alcohol dehydrogenase family)